MSLAKLYSRAIRGIEAPQVIVEVHVANGLPSFSIVGLPDIEVKESRDRVRSAIQNCGFSFPARRITVNLAPADFSKDSSRYDLPIAIGVLIASKLITTSINLENFEFTGELALDGSLRSNIGTLAIAAKVYPRSFVLPRANAFEASIIENIKIFAIDSLQQLVKSLIGQTPLVEYSRADTKLAKDDFAIDFNQVRGQNSAKRALEIAASGKHSILMVGNPGCGKSILAQRIKTILPKLEHKDAVETAALYSIDNNFEIKNWAQVPFRQPHHSSSVAAIIGGGIIPKPGEISLAHNGVLFLDELAEFDRKVLETLREPLETKKINLARAKLKVEYPANFQLIAAMNPCYCGNRLYCRCTSDQIKRYKSKISAPLLDRIDMVVQMADVEVNKLKDMPTGESSDIIQERVIACRRKQINRQNKLNYELNNKDIDKYCQLEEKALITLNNITQKANLSIRAYYKIIKVARTIADMENSEIIQNTHIAQSFQFKVGVE